MSGGASAILESSPAGLKAPASVPPSRQARVVITILLIAALVCIRVLFIFRYRIDSDEPQHLHVIWGWTRGLAQYKDVFDNHTPFFHLLCAPVFRAVGERADALLWMRLLMAPLFFFCLWCVYRLGKAIHSERAGRWGAFFVAVAPGFCFTITEFRPDDLWTAFWLAALVALFEKPLTNSRAFFAGLLIGASLATSLKSLALIGCLCAGTAVSLLFYGNIRELLSVKRAYICLGLLLLGCAILPALITVYLHLRGILPDALYGIFKYNAVSGMGRFRIRRDYVIGVIEFVGCLSLLLLLSLFIARKYIQKEKRSTFSCLFLSSGFFGALIHTLWPLLDAEHLIPFWPVFILCLTPALLRGVSSCAALSGMPSGKWRELIAPALVIAAALISEVWMLRKNEVKNQIAAYGELLAISNPTDYVMDLKGELIFRQRAHHNLFEGVGVARAKKNLMPDTIPEDMIRTRTCITTHDNWHYFFPRARRFMNENYLNTGSHLRVLGHRMKRREGQRAFEFTVVIPTEFAFVAAGKIFKGEIDGRACAGFADLAVGKHKFHAETDCENIDFVWRQAVTRGFFPWE